MNTTNTKKPAPVKGKNLGGYTMYNVAELVSILQITDTSVRKYIREGKIRGQRIGRGYLVSEEALKRFLGVD